MTRWAHVVALNLAMGAAWPDVLLTWPLPLRMLVVTLALVWWPGVAWNWIWRRRANSMGSQIARPIVVSTLVLLFAVTGLALIGLSPTAKVLWGVLWALTNVGIVLGLFRLERRRRPWPTSVVAAGLTMFLLSAVLLSHVAVRWVPPLVDHDMDMQGPGYSLLTRLSPRVLHDRGLVYYFAHPPLLHVYVAASIALHGQLEALRQYDLITQAATGPLDDASVQRTFEHYQRVPLLAETRAPGVVFGAAVVALIGVLAMRRSRQTWLGVLIAAVYLTNPEVLVRSSYAGYYAVSALAALLMWLDCDRPLGARRFAWSSLWASLVNHKLVLMPMGLVVGAWIGASSLRSGWRRTSGAVVAFVVGTLVFWAWGLVIDPASLVADHLRHHLLDRVTHTNPLGYAGYLSMSGLWWEFAQHTGLWLMPVALGLAVWDWRHAQTAREAQWVAMLVGWVMVTAVVFSVVDWRMTKHVSPLLVALPLLLAPPRRAPWARRAVTVATCVWLIVWNLNAMTTLAQDFHAFVVTPDW